MTSEVKEQLEFVDWLKSKKMYNEFTSAPTMQRMMAVWKAMKGPKFDKTHCSQCGGEFGPGDAGYSHCEDHT